MKTIYELNRSFWDFAFDNPEKIKPNHCAVYYFALEHCNRLGWKDKFGFPTSMVMEATGIKSYSVYKKAFDELVEFGFIHVIEYSRNQHSSNVIALKENNKAHSKATVKALDKALSKHNSEHSEKHLSNQLEYNNTIIQDTNLPNTTNIDNLLMSEIKISDVPESELEYFNIANSFYLLFKRNSEEVLKVKWNNLSKTKYKKCVNPIRLLLTNDNRTIEELQAVYKFLQTDDFWMKNIQSTEKLRIKFDQLITKTSNVVVNNQKIKTDEQQHNERVQKAGLAIWKQAMGLD